MEAARNLLSSAPPFPPWLLPRTRTSPPSSSSQVLFPLHDRAALPSVPVGSLVRGVSVSLPAQELQELDKSLLFEATDDDLLFPRMLRYGKVMESGLTIEDDDSLEEFERLWKLDSSPKTKDSWSMTMHSVETDVEKLLDNKLNDVVALAKQALSASKEAASIVDLLVDQPRLDAPYLSPSGDTEGVLDSIADDVKAVRSTRKLERRSKRRKVAEPNIPLPESTPRRKAPKKMLSNGVDSDSVLRLFLRGSETRQLLTAAEESKLIQQVQDLMRLEKVKSRIQSESGREPTLIEWAEAVGIPYTNLQSQLNNGQRCREKLVLANLRMVVHVAKLYQGRGMGLQDLLQEGSMGLMRSIEKFKPQAGCRFASYAYWWIRQTIRKAIFQHSRTIRLPESFYALLSKVAEAKRCCIQEGDLHPTKEEIAKRVGITVNKLEKLLFAARTPISMQQTVWTDQETTYQEIVVDPTADDPEVTVAKQLMRRHTRNLLNVLSPKERRIIKLRYGMEDGQQKSLSEVGNMYGLTKERVRQLENRALYRLKQSLGSQGLHAYSHLLV
ncbi:hypothetical protein MLD38_026610 [Melastoma candidum]|uniref:Uncharacterized protein n=1 Tax=Melastoma candidum TaxID=119954 RepID=A0ACB9P452_9MYRT|nr:hypothetical protein MLD38_026610 [Melastoma candidum]